MTDHTKRQSVPTIRERFTVTLNNGRFVSSPTDTTTDIPAFRAVFDDRAEAESAAVFHGGGVLVPWVSGK